jgi:hypothetical protein
MMQRKSGSGAARSAQLAPAVIVPWINTTGGPSPTSMTRAIEPRRSSLIRPMTGSTPIDVRNVSSAASS